MTRQESEALLSRGQLGRLSMIGADNRPYVIPVRFLWHNGGVYMRLSHAGRKAEALAHNARVCFEVDAFTPNFSDYASVIVEGIVADVVEPVEKEDALFRFHEKYGRVCGTGVPTRPVTINGVALRKLLVENVSGRRKEPEETIATVPASAPAWRDAPKRNRRVRSRS